jgi:hypothetical protein
MMTDLQQSAPPGTATSEEPDRSPVLVELLDEAERADEPADERARPASQPQPTRTPAPRPFTYD